MTQEEGKNRGLGDHARKGNWYLITGFAIGILIGLIVSWVFAPVKYVDTVPSSLRSDFKDEFRSQIASAFYSNNNLARAKERLDLLGDPDPIQALTYQAQNLVDNGDPTNTAFLLAFLTSALKQNSSIPPDLSSTIPLSESIAATSDKSTTDNPTGTSLATTLGTPSQLINTPTLRPSSTPSPTPGSLFVLKSNLIDCDNSLKSPLLQIEVKNSANLPISGIEIIITWSDGEEHFFTGLKPEISGGYADYLMAASVVYSIQIAQGSAAVTNLIAPSCSTESGGNKWGNIKLVFQQP